MTLTDPRDALADQSSFIDYLVGLAGIGRSVRALAVDGPSRRGAVPDDDEFVHVLLGIAALGSAVEGLVETPASQGVSGFDPDAGAAHRRWLR